MTRRSIVALISVFAFTACAARSPEQPVVYDAQALLKAAPALASVALVHMDSRDTLYRFTSAQVESLKTVLKKSSASESLQLTPSPWPVALVLGTDHGSFVALHYGNVLRVNAFHPWSTLIADSAGNTPAKGIADIRLDADDEEWIWNMVQKATGTPPSKSYRVPGIPLKPRY